MLPALWPSLGGEETYLRREMLGETEQRLVGREPE